MSSIHFVGGEKGGVGKSVLSRLLCQWMIDHAVPLSALDADVSHGALVRAYAAHCRVVDLSVFESADQIMDRALGMERAVVVDLPAKSLRDLLRWMAEGDVVALAQETDVRLVFWQVTDGSFHSTSTLQETLPQLDPSVEVVVVRNQRWTDDFSQLEASPALERVRERGGKTIDLPALDPPVMYKMERRGVSLSTALRDDGNDDTSLTVMERRRVGRWLKSAYEAIDPILQRSHAPPLKTPVETEGLASAPPLKTPVETEGLASAPPPEPPVESLKQRPPVGTTWKDGPNTWTEVGEGYLTHHVRYR